MSAVDLKVNYAFLCDDSRREDNGKLLFIGVYGSNMIFPDLPTTTRLCLVLNFSAEKAGECPIEFKMMQSGKMLAKGETTLSVDAGMNFAAFPQIPVRLLSKSPLTVEASFAGAAPITLVTVEIDTSGLATVSGQPSEQSPPAAPAS